jgi:hypothetical protein
MKSILSAVLLSISLFACQKEKNEIIEIQQNSDWYILTSPDDNSIKGVYGDIDQTLTITTGPKIYQTTDKGKTWSTSNFVGNQGLFGFLAKEDTLLALSTKSGRKFLGDEINYYAKDPRYFSLDHGNTWIYYNNLHDSDSLTIPMNRILSPSGTVYQIRDVLVGNTGNLIGSIESSAGNKLTLPKMHYIQSLYFDSKSRIYVSTDAPVCKTGNRLVPCGPTNGVLYISKRAQR